MLFSLITAALLLLIYRAASALVTPPRRIPWVAVALTALVLAGLILQASWGGAMAALDSDPARAGWWRPLTSVFLQNGGFLGDLWNLIAIAVIAAYAEWFWGPTAAVALFLAGVLLPHLLELLAATELSTDPRNFAGSSGATYFLGATLAGALARTGPGVRPRLLALAVPALGLLAWFTQANGHGLVAAEGFVLGLLVLCARRRLLARAQLDTPDGRHPDTSPAAAPDRVPAATAD